MPQAKAENKYAINRLLEMYLRVVVKIALSSYKNKGYELDDLIQEGALGLLRAIRHYDFSKHGSFISYLPWWIMQYINRAIAVKSRNIRVPVHLQEKIKIVNRTVETIHDKLLNQQTINEISKEFDMPVDHVEKLINITDEMIPIDFIIEKEDNDLFTIKLLTSEKESPHKIYYEKELKENLTLILKTLTVREEAVISLRYGLYDDCVRTLEEVGKIFNITRERVRQIEAKALRKLRHSSKIKKLKSLL